MTMRRWLPYSRCRSKWLLLLSSLTKRTVLEKRSTRATLAVGRAEWYPPGRRWWWWWSSSQTATTISSPSQERNSTGAALSGLSALAFLLLLFLLLWPFLRLSASLIFSHYLGCHLCLLLLLFALLTDISAYSDTNCLADCSYNAWL